MGKILSGREGFGQALLEMGSENEKIVALCADLAESVKVHFFAEKFPERYFQIGIAEQDMIGTAAGLALSGYIPFATTYAVFAANRANEQIRLAACYNQANVKIAVSHAGLTTGEDGATHQALEDIASMRAMPEMTVIVPADANEAYEATRASAELDGPVYLRLGRTPVPTVTKGYGKYKIGKARKVSDGKDVTLIACGIMVEKAIVASEMLAQEGINAAVVDMHTIKPIDEEMIIKQAEETGCIVTAEEHSIIGGLGGAVAEVVSENCPVPLVRVGTKDTFGESGPPEELLKKYGLTSENIVEAAKRAMSRKKVNV
ncbi:transketolase family protein [Aquibacillus salsiterrae]|uniref:Transketolase family protein n=1 Tax=Aquibacillus salsiterrae TaxID=2950439 RepID=A0A9X3WEV7_9BACI|nr:transketolase family protein [Aquibacillus salsiterrae]MDC3418547.1 transketolase family protein [Aquibacillus salsiterrae]